MLVLKTGLIQRLVETGDGKAAGEVGETLELVRDLAGDVRAVAHGSAGCSLEDELAAARALLESVGVRCQINVRCRDLSGRMAQALTYVLREAITNVLRHAAAQECAIRLVERGGVVELSVWNDGVRPSRAEGGIGLADLAERVAELGGWATLGDACNGQFAFTVHMSF
ncbi:sensor histidine kinase [Nonomuraea sp. NPDC050536]|uniref:sensor histidine kinase n=1 Tax=Nonomuraea sp. NPDC050536 TaxID=3364366 RepID=UPI0037CC443F